jgi:8-oxo-dGTP pyrophosphatase MutT (NUDIX family)
MMRLVYLAYRIYCFIFRPLTLGVRVMMIQNDQVLLVRQTYINGWFMPGGGVKRGETLDQAARREAHEETGATLNNLRLVGAYTNFKEWKSDHNILFLSTDFTISGEHDFEIAEIRFFSLDALPADLLSGHRQRLEQYWDRKPLDPFGEW